MENYSNMSNSQLLIQKTLHPEHQVLIDSVLEERVKERAIEREREERAIEREREKRAIEREREERAIEREREERAVLERDKERAFQLQLAQLNKASPSGKFYTK